MKNRFKNLNRIQVLSSIIFLLFISTSCNNSDKSKTKENEEPKTTFNLENEQKELQKTVIAFREALTKKDAKAAALISFQLLVLSSKIYVE